MLLIGAEMVIAQTANIDKVWVDYNTYENNQLGIRIHIKFNVIGLKDKKICVMASFYNEKKEEQITCHTEGYKTSSNKMVSYKYTTPIYENSIYNDCQLFMPYDVFSNNFAYNLFISTDTYYFYVSIIDNDNWKRMAASDWFVFQFPSEKPIQFKPTDEWFKQARINCLNWQVLAYRGNAEAQYNTGLCYEFGIDVGQTHVIRKDLEMAISFYEMAANQNYEPAKKRLSALPHNQLSTITFTSSTTSSTTSYNLRAGIKSSCKITNISVSVNNARGIDVVVNDGNDFTLNRNLQLNYGSNTITVSVTNCAGTTTKNLVVNVQGNLPPQPSNRRVAIVIGNSNYPKAPLTNPVNDATDMAAILRTLGFDVTLKTDLTHSGFENALKNFKYKADNSDVALLYYAGHGMEIDGNNYLIPVDAPINDIDQLKYKSVDAYYALDILSGAKKKIIILDACRNNPSTRGALHGGLAAMNATNALIAYSTSPGKTAADGSGRNSPYTYALLNALNNKNLTLPQLFQMVAKNVSAQKTGQIPWYVSSLVEDVILNR